MLATTLAFLPIVSALIAAPPRGDFLVVRIHLEEKDAIAEKFRAVAGRAAEFHHADTIDFDGVSADGLLAELRARLPENVLFVVRPEDLDINLHRRIVSICNRVDDDLFADFSFGYLTARTPEALESLWSRTVELHQKGLANRTWAQSSITSGQKSTRYADGVSGIRKDAGFAGPALYFAEVGSDADGPRHVGEWLPELNAASVIDITGNADPQGIWMFSGERNRDRSKHWTYDPAKIGQDPERCMPRIRAEAFRALRLSSAIVWSGACHTGATHRVFVENDIVSTFGRTNATTLYELPTDQSIVLALIDAGATAFLGPIGPNHGYSTIDEQEFALENGASLGEAIKATYDDALLATGGNPVLPRYVAGQPQPDEPNVMAAGGLNRMLIGDPSLRPFGRTVRKGEEVLVEHARGPDGSTPGSFDVVVRWDDGFHAMGWDMFGGNRQRDWRIVARVDLDDPALKQAGAGHTFTASLIDARDDDGRVLGYRLAHADYEHHFAHRWLHLQANIARDEVKGKAVEVRFHVHQSP